MSDDGQTVSSVKWRVVGQVPPKDGSVRSPVADSGVGFQAGVGVRMHEHLSEQQRRISLLTFSLINRF
jgi:hypothetical protein